MKNNLSLAFMILGALCLLAFASPYHHSGCLDDVDRSQPHNCWDLTSEGERFGNIIDVLTPVCFMISFLTWKKEGLP